MLYGEELRHSQTGVTFIVYPRSGYCDKQSVLGCFYGLYYLYSVCIVKEEQAALNCTVHVLTLVELEGRRV